MPELLFTAAAIEGLAPQPSLWPGHQRIQWGCALAMMLGEATLVHLPLLLSGAHASLTSAAVVAHSGAVRRVGELMGGLPTRRSVQRAAFALAQHADDLGYDPCFRIDAGTLAFELIEGQQARVLQAWATMQAPATRLLHGLTIATGPDLVARPGSGAEAPPIRLRLPRLPLTAPPRYDLLRQPAQDLRVTMVGLEDTARWLDELDAAPTATWSRERWLSRLQNVIRLQACEPGGLVDTDVLDLSGLRHLIGLPGAGKTTLITLLCAHLARENKRVAVFFTSIETAREYLEKLLRYGVSSALLMGRSSETHQRHANRLAELIGADNRDRGFARTRPGAELLAQTCPLPAFATDEDAAWPAWPSTAAPCERLFEAGDMQTPHLCPLWSSCGRVRNQRELVTAQVWLGHVRSADTQVPAHACAEKLTYFELIGQTFDLVVFDEVDEAQKSLDEVGSHRLHLSGTDNSEHVRSQAVTGQVLTGRRSLRDSRQLMPYQSISNLFERHLLRFYDEVGRLLPPAGTERGRYDDQAAALFELLENRPLTTNYLVRLALRRAPEQVDSAGRSARYAFWDGALYAAFHNESAAGWLRAAELAADLPFGSEADTQAAWLELRQAFADYLHAFPTNIYLTDELTQLTACFARLVAPAPAAELDSLTRVLVAVGFTVATYQQLSGITRPLVFAGLLPPEASRHEASAALQLAVPQSLLGVFSSVRFSRLPDDNGIVLDYLILNTAPRLLLHRLHEKLANQPAARANVLLASATSWLPASPAYHVAVPPSYVLLPRQQQQVQLRLRCLPLQAPGAVSAGQDAPPALLFSGAGRNQLPNLRAMVRQLAIRPAPDRLSLLEKAAEARRTPAPGRRLRKCALVVNSYEQVLEVLRELRRANSPLSKQTRGVVRHWPEEAELRQLCVLRGQVEALGHEEDVLVVVFPLPALGRGINIVFHPTDPHDADSGTAALGSVYFLTRPHPVLNDLTLMLSRVAEQTQQFDALRFDGQPLADVATAYAQHRRDLFQDTMQLLSQPMQASRLPAAYRKAFAANLLIPVLQTIGRAIRGSRPADIYFVDAAWAPNSAKGQPDTAGSSVLVTMRELLREYMQTSDPLARQILHALYAPFAEAFEHLDGLLCGPPENDAADADSSTYFFLEDQGDLD